jgi:hypothetical protein
MTDEIVPRESIMCLALIRPGSKIDILSDAGKPTFAIYEFSREFGSYEIRFGDGSRIKLDAEDHNDLILLREFSGDRLDAFTDTWFVGKADESLMAVARGIR